MKVQWFRLGQQQEAPTQSSPSVSRETKSKSPFSDQSNVRRWITVGTLALLLVAAGYASTRLNNSAGENELLSSGKQSSTELQSAQSRKTDEQTNVKDTASDTSALQESKEEVVVVETVGSLDEFVQERESVRNSEIKELDKLIQGKNTSEKTRKEAEEQKLGLIKSMEQEMTVQGLLAAKGFENAVVTVHEDSVNVIVHTQEITQAQAARILETTTRETGESIDNIKIIAIK